MKPIVVDSSAIVAMLVEGGDVGEWVAKTVEGRALVAPDLMTYEAANILRRQRLAKIITDTVATSAHRDLLDLTVEYYSYAPLSERIWQLRENLTIYDAAYVALAEKMRISLITLDAKLTKASGPQCEITSFPE